MYFFHFYSVSYRNFCNQAVTPRSAASDLPMSYLQDARVNLFHFPETNDRYHFTAISGDRSCPATGLIMTRRQLLNNSDVM